MPTFDQVLKIKPNKHLHEQKPKSQTKQFWKHKMGDNWSSCLTVIIVASIARPIWIFFSVQSINHLTHSIFIKFHVGLLSVKMHEKIRWLF